MHKQLNKSQNQQPSSKRNMFQPSLYETTISTQLRENPFADNQTLLIGSDQGKISNLE